MRQTENYALNLPEGQDNYNKNDYNDNFKIIDEKMKELADRAVGEVIELNVTENGTYIAPDGKTYNPVIVNVAGGGGTTATSIDIVDVLPSTLVEGAVYLIPNGEQVCPSIPTGYQYNVICIDKNDVGGSYNRPSTQDVLNATKFWLFQDNATQPKNRRDYITIITWGTGATTSTKPSKIYEYDTSGAFEWIDITDDASTDTDFQNNTILHDNRDTIYSDTDIYRFTLGNLEYNTEINKINNLCKLTDIFYIDDFDVYFVENGTATSQGSHTLKWVAENFS